MLWIHQGSITKLWLDVKIDVHLSGYGYVFAALVGMSS